MVRTSDILFFDLEVHKKSKHILEIGALLRGDQLRKKSVESFVHFAGGASLLCGHNIIDHDLPILKKYPEAAGPCLQSRPSIPYTGQPSFFQRNPITDW
jgi:hypothetical protein